MRAALVVGARPNFMKIAPLMREFKSRDVDTILIHTGQHYDKNMSKVFFEDLELPEPDIYLGVGSGSHAEQTARVMIAFEEIVIEKKPDIIIVVGDVNSTVACSLVGAKLHVPVAHVEAGLRSFDLDMPEVDEEEREPVADLNLAEFDLSAFEEESSEAVATEEPAAEFDLGELDMELDAAMSEAVAEEAPVASMEEKAPEEPAEEDEMLGLDEVATKLDLAKAYIDMGDPDGARAILDEVLNEGSDEQKSEAQGLINEL